MIERPIPNPTAGGHGNLDRVLPDRISVAEPECLNTRTAHDENRSVANTRDEQPIAALALPACLAVGQVEAMQLVGVAWRQHHRLFRNRRSGIKPTVRLVDSSVKRLVSPQHSW